MQEGLKLEIMKTVSTQQEVLLITGTSFSSRQWEEKDGSSNAKQLSEREKLEEACWNGLLKEMLPEIFDQIEHDKIMYMWQIREAASFLKIDLGELPETKEKYYSIDPYCFLAEQSAN